MRKKIGEIGAIILMLLPFLIARGQENEWMVTEVMANAVDEATGEFLEWQYTGSEEVYLSGWTVQDNKEEDDLVDFVGEYDVGKSGLVVSSGDFLLIVDADYAGQYNSNWQLSETDLSAVVMVTVVDGEIGNGLGNASDEVVLKDSEGVVVAAASWQGDAGNGISWELVGSSWQKCDLEQGNSLGWWREEIIEEDDDTEVDEEDTQDEEEDEEWERFWQSGEDPILFNELLINPVGEEKAGEWVELKSYWSEEIDLDGWWLCDNKCNEQSKTGGYQISDISVGENGLIVIERNDSQIALNNDADSIFLFDPNHDLVAGVQYDIEVGEGESLAWDGTSWLITNEVTKGEENIIQAVKSEENGDSIDEQDTGTEETEVNGDENNDYQQLSIADAKAEPEGAKVEIEGVVTAEWGLLESKYVWLQDGEAGLSVKFEEDPQLTSGDKVWIKGKRKNLTYREVVEVEDWKKTGDSEEIAKIIKTGEMNLDEDRLVKITGNVVTTNGNDFTINDGNGESRVYIKENTGIIKPEMKKGDTVEVQGIVNEIKSGWRILPRYQDDVTKSDQKLVLPSVGLIIW